VVIELCPPRPHIQRCHPHIVIIIVREIALPDRSKIQRADAQFKKAQRMDDGRKAMAEYEAQREAVRANTERLRALRLARDAALKAAPSAAPSAPKRKTAKRPQTGSAA
jgi:hypothetical protein